MSGNDGALTHMYVDTEFAEIDQTAIDSLEFAGGLYEIQFPQIPPHSDGLSLVVDSIIGNDIMMKWDLGSAGSTGLSSNNGNNLVLKAPINLTNNLNLSFPDYSHATNLTNTVLTVVSDDGAGNVQMGYIPKTSLTDPVMISDNSNQITLKAPNSLHTTAVITMPGYDGGGSPIVNRVLYVRSDDAVGNVELAYGNPSALFPPQVTNGAHTMQLAASPLLSTGCTMRLPRYNASGLAGQYLHCSSDDQSGLFSIDFTNEIITDTLKLGSLTVTSNPSATDPLQLIAPANLHSAGDPVNAAAYVNLYTNRLLGVSGIDGSGALQLAFLEPGAVRNEISGNTFRMLLSTASSSYTLQLPALSGAASSSSSSEGKSIEVASDDGSHNLVTHFVGYKRIIDQSTSKSLYLRTTGSASDYSLFLPAYQSTFGSNAQNNQALVVTSSTSSAVTLGFQNPSKVFDALNVRSATLVAAPSMNSDFSLVLPFHDSAIGTGYIGRVLQVKNSDGSTVELEFAPAANVTSVSGVGLVNASNATTNIKADATTTESFDLHLPDLSSVVVGQVLAVKTVGFTSITTEFSDTGRLRASNTGLFLGLCAPDSLSSAYNFHFPNDFAGKTGKALVVTGYHSDGGPNVEFTDPTSLVLSSNNGSNTTSLRSFSNLTNRYSVVLPDFNNSIANSNAGLRMGVLSQTIIAGGSVDLNLGFVEPGLIYDRVVSGTSVSLGNHILLSAASGLPQSTRFRLPPHASGSDHTGKLLSVVSQADYLASGDLSEIHLDLVAPPTPNIVDGSGNAFELLVPNDLGSSYAAHVPAHDPDAFGAPVVAQTVSVASGGSVKAVELAPLDMSYTSVDGSGVGDFLQAPSNGAALFDGISAAISDLILVANQPNAAQNGLYAVVDPGSALSRAKIARATSFDAHARVVSGTVFTATAGSNSGKHFVCSSQQFWRAGRGSVSTSSGSTALTGTDTAFSADGEPVAGQRILVAGEVLTVATVTDDSNLVLAAPAVATVSDAPFHYGHRTGVDPISFAEVDSDTLGVVRYGTPRSVECNSLVLGRDRPNPTELVDRSVARAHKQILILPDATSESAGRRLVLESVQEEHRGRTPTLRCSLGLSGGSEMLYIYGTEGVVSLPGSGVTYKDAIVASANIAHGIAFLNTSVRGSIAAPAELRSSDYGVGSTQQANWKLMPKRSGLYRIVFMPKFIVDIDNADALVGGLVRTSLKIDSTTKPSSSFALDQEHCFPDTDIFNYYSATDTASYIMGSGLNPVRKVITFMTELTKDVEFYIEITHSKLPSGTDNGRFRLDAGSSLMIERID